MEYIMLFINWLKAFLAKETLFAFVCIPLSGFLTWVADLGFKEQLANLNLDSSEGKYWIYLFVSFALIIYGIRLMENVIKMVLLPKEKKE